VSHPGIRLRISTPAGVAIEGDSDWLHYQARWVHDISTGQWHAVAAHCDPDGTPLFTVELMLVTLDDPPAIPDDPGALGDDS